MNEPLQEVIVHIPPMLAWAAGVMAIAIVGLLARVEQLHAHIIKGISRQGEVLDSLRTLETMHEHPDDYKFGNSETNRMVLAIGNNCEQVCKRHSQVLFAIERLAQLIAYDIEQRTGKRPPPMPIKAEDAKV
jgi:hypothetical protein